MQISKSDFDVNILAKLKELEGKIRKVEPDEINTILNDNYKSKDIVFKSQVRLEVEKHNEKQHKVIGHYACNFSEKSCFPEVQWDHITGSLLTSVANQVGKILHCVCGNTNGVNLLSLSIKVRKPAPPSEITLILESIMFPKFNSLWAKSKIEFFHKKDFFAEIKCLTHGIGRVYK